MLSAPYGAEEISSKKQFTGRSEVKKAHASDFYCLGYDSVTTLSRIVEQASWVNAAVWVQWPMMLLC